jgi:hypothetical protein
MGENIVHSGPQERTSIPTETVARAAYSLSRAQRYIVGRGCFSGDFTMAAVRALKRKGLFYHHITSPNGRSGPMELTELGKAVQAHIAAEGESASHRASGYERQRMNQDSQAKQEGRE